MVKTKDSEDWEGKSEFAESDIGGTNETSINQAGYGRRDPIDWGTEVLGEFPE